uniref:Uncharacterized protein n=1 Tax=Anguilla anguilla TaxID=7936 RepID=A0A0E9WU92_ANGAN
MSCNTMVCNLHVKSFSTQYAEASCKGIILVTTAQVQLPSCLVMLVN